MVILPTGSVEQHGAHLPAGTDIFAAEAIAEEVARLMNGLILPGGSVGVTPMHMPYESTISLSPNTYSNLIFDICNLNRINISYTNYIKSIKNIEYKTILKYKKQLQELKYITFLYNKSYKKQID